MATQNERDHETSGAKEWQLPRNIPTPKPADRRINSSVSILRNSGTISKQSVKKPVIKQSNSQKSLSAHSLVAKYALPTREIPRDPTGAKFMTGINRASHFQAPSRFPKDSEAKTMWRAGSPPTETFNLPALYGTYKYKISQAGKDVFGIGPSYPGRFDVLEQICQKTSAFVKPPPYNEKKVCLWGNNQQVSAAKDLMLQIVKLCNARTRSEKVQQWAKIKAHSVLKEDRIDYKEEQETFARILRKAPSASLKIKDRLLFSWPDEELPIREVLGSELQALDFLRTEFKCHIYRSKELSSYVCVEGAKPESLHKVASRLMSKWHESLATCNVRSKVYLVEIPEARRTMTGISVKKVENIARASFPPTLSTDAQHEVSLEWLVLMRSKNESRLLNAVERSLRSLPFIEGQLRMRVNLGSFIFDEYRVPRDTDAGYSFEEFREMLLHEKTKGRLVPGLDIDQNALLGRVSRATHLLEPVSGNSSLLTDVKPQHTVNFEFEGSDNALLRLEVEFRGRGGSMDHEITQGRWVKAQAKSKLTDGRPLLQAVMIDPWRADWQLEIRDLQLLDTSSMSPSMQKFAREVCFKEHVDNETLSMKPRRRTNIPGGVPVCRIIEKAAVYYRVKSTGYILEIARYDQYLRDKPAQRYELSDSNLMEETPTISWGASLFSPDWDSLLRGHANTKFSDSTPLLNNFFQYEVPGLGSGFKSFTSLVKEIAMLLSTNSQGTSPSQQQIVSSTSKDTTNHADPHHDAQPIVNLLDAELGTMF